MTETRSQSKCRLLFICSQSNNRPSFEGFRRIAQLVEQRIPNPQVPGSSPGAPAILRHFFIIIIHVRIVIKIRGFPVMARLLSTAFVFFLMPLMVFTASGQASRSPDAPNCHFIGEIQNIEVRKEKGKGLSEGRTFKYIDITVHKVKSAEEAEGLIGCSDDEIQTFQMHGSFLGIYDTSVPKKGECIKGYSNYMGDGNFLSGNWLTVQEKLPSESCK